MLRTAIAVCAILSLTTGRAVANPCEENERGLWSGAAVDESKEAKLAMLFQCIDTSNKAEYKLRDATACNWFVGTALRELYQVDDFRSGEGYLLANQIAEGLYKGEFTSWNNLGPASSQESLDKATKAAADGRAVVAVYYSEVGSGHVALVLPGGAVDSQSWGRKVPRAASVSLGDIKKSFIGCRLSAAFSAAKSGATYLHERIF